MSQIASSNLNSLAEAFHQHALQYRTVALHHITIRGICPASRIGRPTEQVRTLLARLITHRGFLHDHAMVFLDQGDPEPFGLSVFYTPDEGGKKAFEAFQVLAEQAYRKAVALTDSTTTYWTFRNAAHERPAHLWAVGLERWAHSEEAISGIIPVERTPVQVEDNRLQMPGRHLDFGIGGSLQVVDEAAYLIKNADRVDELKEDLFSASESAVQWLVEQLEPTEADAMADKAGNGLGSAGSATATDWRDVQRRLLQLYERGDAYSSIGDLAKRLVCAKATIQKAIKNSTKLKGWQARHTTAKGSPRASSLTKVVLDNAEQTREPNPAEEAEANDVDTVFARLIQEAKPEERAKLNDMTAEQRQQLVTLVQNDPDRYDRVLGRKP